MAQIGQRQIDVKIISVVYSIFKKEKSAGEKNEEQKGSNVVLYHINITKIPSTDQIASSIDCLKNVIRNEYHVVAKKINNLCSICVNWPASTRQKSGPI